MQFRRSRNKAEGTNGSTEATMMKIYVEVTYNTMIIRMYYIAAQCYPK